MPSASDEDRERMRDWFGDPVSDAGPTKLLIDRGYGLTHGWTWVKPTPSHTVHEIEWICIQFLADEWDFGGLEAQDWQEFNYRRRPEVNNG